MDCRAPGLPNLEGSGSELTHCTISALDDILTQEDEYSSELELSKVFEKLEQMKQRVLYLRGLLIRPPESSKTDCGSDSDQMQLELEQTGSKDVELRKVQQDTAQACLQISEVSRKLKESKISLARLDEKVQRNIRCTKKLAKRLLEVPKWQEELKHNVGLCIERYNDLDISRGNYLQYSDNYARPIQTNMKYSYSSKVPIICYKQDYMQLYNGLNRTRKVLMQCYDQLMKYTQDVDEALTSGQEKFPIGVSISELSMMLDANASATKHRRSSARLRKSFKFGWAAPLPEKEKHWLTVSKSETDN
ncbi:uncharacterized protein LOC108089766 [Drosophila ficusphila]|uniref:uncharacterized protein LOC108089766 n=1 Tax=Drosophila ficusphila TaxID=30025 RepID=UPI0007E7C762|nr:uncharacterized protein LOC108089766 [Drosophila ficusphila]